MLILFTFCKTLVTAVILVSMHSETVGIFNAGVFKLVPKAQIVYPERHINLDEK